MSTKHTPHLPQLELTIAILVSGGIAIQAYGPTVRKRQYSLETSRMDELPKIEELVSILGLERL